MKKILIFLLSILVTPIIAQDVIVLNDNTTILSKIIEITSSEVKYKKSSNLNGPTYIISLSEIIAINYENGEKELLKQQNTSSLIQDKNGVESTQCVSGNNDSLIGLHNKTPFFTSLKQSKKKAKKFFPIMAISEHSILSTDQIELKFVPKCVEDYDFNNRFRIKYYIRLRNKTDKIIYIDRAHCFRKDNNEASMPYFNTKTVSISLGAQGGVGANYAINNRVGISAVGGTSNVQSSTYSQQRLIFIPPGAEVNLSEYVYDEVRKIKTLFTTNYKTIFDIETWDFNLLNWNGTLCKGEVKECVEDNSPYKSEYHIIYSTDKDFNSYSVLNAKLYAKYLVGIDYNNWSEVFSFERIRKYISNFLGVEGKADILIGQPNVVGRPSVTKLLLK